MVLFALTNFRLFCFLLDSTRRGGRADLRRFNNMSVQASQKTTTTYRTVKVASPEPVTSTVMSAASVSPTPYALNGYETVRYLVPVQPAVQQQQHSYVLMQQPMMQQTMIQQPMIQQPMMQQVVSPVYLQNLQHVSVSSQDSDLLYHQSAVGESGHITVNISGNQ